MTTKAACRNCGQPIKPCPLACPHFFVFNRAGTARDCAGWVHVAEVAGLDNMHTCEGASAVHQIWAEPARQTVMVVIP